MTKPAATSDWRDSEPVARLTYPFEQTPGHGEALDIVPGVKWMRMPLGGSLQFINVWALKDEGGWTVVDTGIAGPETAKAWRTIFADHLNGEPVTRIIVTHMHPDHTGMAGWIAKKFQCRLWITRLEYLMCRVLSADTGRAAPEEGIAFYRTAGWDAEDLDHYRSRFGGFGRGMHQLPDSYRRISDGEVIRIGDHDWRVVVGNGHSPEHACLYCAELNLFISGDQVLPRISSNVSVFPTEPDGDPLDDWLTSLRKIQGEIPPDVLVLPAHNDPFLGLHRRLEHLTNGHERALNRLEKALVEPKRAVDVFGLLFKRRIDADQKGMATGEAVAHLNCLMHRQKVSREADKDGVWWYRTVA
jgi:glyoxylase-like metal-dependent hydrolase (beta-lactamase superfamily II)